MTPEELFNKNQKLVGWCFKKYIKEYNAIDFEDIMQEGMLGLWAASIQYDESKDIKFSTFAVYYILGNMKRYIREKRTTIRIPSSAFNNNDTETIDNIRNTISLNSEVYKDDGLHVELLEVVGGTPDEYECITEDLIDNFLLTIENPKHRDIMEEYYYAYVWSNKIPQADITEKYNISQPQVSRIVHRYNMKFMKYLKDTQSE